MMHDLYYSHPTLFSCPGGNESAIMCNPAYYNPLSGANSSASCLVSNPIVYANTLMFFFQTTCINFDTDLEFTKQFYSRKSKYLLTLPHSVQFCLNSYV